MVSMEQSDIIKNIHKVIQKNESQYKTVSVKAVIIKDQMQIHSALIEFLDTKEITPQNYEYNELLLITELWDIKKTKDAIKKLANENKIILNNVEFEFKGSFSRIEFISSKSRHGYFRHVFPRQYVTYNLQNQVRLPFQPLIAKNMPLFPDGNKAIMDYFKMAANPISYIFFNIPDYRARIDTVTISGQSVQVTVDTKIPLNDISVKFYAEYEQPSDYYSRLEYSMKSPDIEISDETFVYEFDKEFGYVLVSISEKKTGGLIDYRGYNLGWDYQEGVEINREDYDIREIIRRGENLNTEFKLILSEEFLETVVAFANTSGGMILLGVKDDCQVQGYRPKTDDQISNLIDSNIDPRPIYKIYDRIIDDKEITIIEIPEGENKPYCHREKGFYVRSSSNDRHPIRSEMDQFYTDNSSRIYNRFFS